MEQTMMQLSFLSRTTSISYSFQPNSDSSINNSLVGDASKPRLQIASNSSALYAIPPPLPPMVNEGRIMVGKPTSFCTPHASSIECAIPERAEPRPIFVIASLNLERSSALSIASGVAPINSHLYFSSTPCLCKSNAQFNAVCPPIVGKIASGFSFAMMRSKICQVIGSM